MTTIGDLIFWATVLIALIIVPPYFWRVYGLPPIGAWLARGWVKSFQFILLCLGGSERSDAGSSTGSARAVLLRQHQAAPELVLDFEGVLDYLKRHNLTDEQAIDLLTLAHREDGDLLSANKIRDIVGGNEAEVKRRVAGHRPKPAAARSQGRLLRPENGW